jgi:hypothetical protein
MGLGDELMMIHRLVTDHRLQALPHELPGSTLKAVFGLVFRVERVEKKERLTYGRK